MAGSLGTDDPFRDVARWDGETAADWARLLEERAAAPDQLRLRSEVLRIADVRPGDRVLEIGCGTGALLVDLARAAGPSGRVTGIDPQPRFVGAARERLGREGLDDRAAVAVGSAEDIGLPAASVRICVAQTVLVHLAPDALRGALAEVRRVLVPGGRFVTADQDGDTWTIDHADRELTRRIVRFNSDQRYADGWTGRRLRRLLLDAGFEDIETQAVVQVDTMPDSYLFEMAVRIARAASAAGALNARDASAWEERLRERASRGQFFSSMNYYLASARRP